MSKEFNYVTLKERYELIQKAVMGFVEHSSAQIVDIMDGKVNPRQEFENLFDFEAMQMRLDVYGEVKRALIERVLSVNPEFCPESEEISEYVERSICNYIIWVKNRCESGIITWDELKKRLYNVDLQYGSFGIRVQRFGKVYYELHFNYMIDNGDVINLYNAEWHNDDSEDEATIDMASYVSISSKDIKEIDMGNTDLIYGCGLRDVTITYNDGEMVSFRFSEEN